MNKGEMGMIGRGNYPVAEEGCGPVVQATLTDRLTERRVRLASELKKLDAVLAALAENPETQGILDAISELGGL